MFLFFLTFVIWNLVFNGYIGLHGLINLNNQYNSNYSKINSISNNTLSFDTKVNITNINYFPPFFNFISSYHLYDKTPKTIFFS